MILDEDLGISTSETDPVIITALKDKLNELITDADLILGKFASIKHCKLYKALKCWYIANSMEVDIPVEMQIIIQQGNNKYLTLYTFHGILLYEIRTVHYKSQIMVAILRKLIAGKYDNYPILIEGLGSTRVKSARNKA